LFWHRHSLQAGLSSFASGFSAASLIAAVVALRMWNFGSIELGMEPDKKDAL
jgi:hypothetical protein